jgi:hypothetical protein
MTTEDDDRVEVLIRIPRSLVPKLDALAEAKKAPHTKANRNATICTLLERGVADASRNR